MWRRFSFSPTACSGGAPDAADVHSDRRPGDVELVTASICAALQRGAAIHVAGADELPGDPPVAALLRY